MCVSPGHTQQSVLALPAQVTNTCSEHLALSSVKAPARGTACACAGLHRRRAAALRRGSAVRSVLRERGGALLVASLFSQESPLKSSLLFVSSRRRRQLGEEVYLAPAWSRLEPGPEWNLGGAENSAGIAQKRKNKKCVRSPHGKTQYLPHGPRFVFWFWVFGLGKDAFWGLNDSILACPPLVEPRPRDGHEPRAEIDRGVRRKGLGRCVSGSSPARPLSCGIFKV